MPRIRDITGSVMFRDWRFGRGSDQDAFGLGDAELDSEVGDHVNGHGIEVKLGLPVPFGTGAGVVEAVGPRVGDSLTERVEFVFHLEAGDIFADLVVDHFGIKAHRCDVE